ncbi:hypothetical protein HWV62_20340 [Athelia sp. TMB]|nr:hypothetical protein HWV62_20340 [Athelia sp. TMB]
MGFGEKSSPTAAIAAILAAYPFSVGLLREFLQNSDDAKASTQIFVLDVRTHPTKTLYRPELSGTQGPALLACNDALFLESDWEAVQRPHESSKVADTNKIGKYGVGFRSCYHVTDNPQILSGSSLAIFDPHHDFTDTGGAFLDFVEHSSLYEDQLSGFEFFLKGNYTETCPKTIVRLPLRTTAGALNSRIKGEVVEPSKISKIFKSFIEEELSIALLFLTSVTSIKIFEIDDSGARCLAEAELVKGRPETHETGGGSMSTYLSGVNVTRGDNAESQSWRIFSASYQRSEAASVLSVRLGYDVAPALKKQKLHPNIAFAVPLDPHSLKQKKGRLYTFLPLPLSTGFPCHVHALFALTPDRQHLRNGEEKGLVEGVDSVIVEWNRLLFDTFIPNAWAAMIPVLLYQDQFIDIFQTWPPPQPATRNGDVSYWKSLPTDILEAIVKAKLAVWPIASSPSVCSEISFSDLQSLLVADESDDQEVLDALAGACVEITQPPKYIKTLLEKADIRFTPLSPETAHHVLLTNVAALSRMHSDVRATQRITSYMLSLGKIELLIGLPLVRLSNGKFVSLRPNQSNEQHHVLLDQASMDVFREYDQAAIDLSQMAPLEAQLFLSKGANALNVTKLNVEQVLLYLKCVFARYGVAIDSSTDDAVPNNLILWLVTFWEWMGAWELRRQLYPLIGSLHLVPTTRNILVPVKQCTMKDAPVNAPVIEALEGLGLFFIHSEMSRAARSPLVEQGLIKSAGNGIHILEQISHGCADTLRIETVDSLRTHILTSLADFVRVRPLTTEQARTLRSLPIFPTLVVQLGDSMAHVELRAIDGVAKIISATQTTLLPVIPNTVYVKGCEVLQDALPEIFERKTGVELVSLAVEHLVAQSKHMQATIVKYLVHHRDNITVGQKRALAQAPFIAVGFPPKTELRSARELFDPGCDVATLFTQRDYYVPCMSSEDEKAIVHGFQDLGLFRSGLSKEVVEERIMHLSKCPINRETHRLAQNLLQIIIDRNFDVRDVHSIRGTRWLPASGIGRLGTEALYTSEQCHHSGAHSAALFDEVLPTLEVKDITSSMRRALGWQYPLPTEVIINQFDCILNQDSPPFRKLHTIVSELGQRVGKLAKAELETLTILTSRRPWIPISKGCIVVTGRAVLSSRINLPPGFHKVPGSLSDDSDIRRFLLLLGCTEKPTKGALLEELRSLPEIVLSEERTSTAIGLLTYMAYLGSTNEDLKDALIPTAGGDLHKIDSVYYNDLAARNLSAIPRLPSESYIAHPLVTFELARQLHLTFLGHREAVFKSLLRTDKEMGESLTNRIKTVLSQYSAQQAFTEFIANAADAGAQRFAIILDDWFAPAIQVLTPPLGEYQSNTSLVVYNDSIFKDEDFYGIMDLGRGGKNERTDTIGQFGLGALTMFHFTDTLFRLPLRTAGSPLSEQFLDASKLRSLIEGHYWNVAAQTLMFTKLELIEALHRDQQRKVHDIWSVKTKRAQEQHNDGDFTIQSLRIDSSSEREAEDGDWYIHTYERKEELPSQFQELSSKHRLRHPIRVSFAAGPSPRQTRGKIFATMPLPTPSGLPVHFHAPFILAPDRRSIRLDGVEAQYNTWLRETVAPPLYIYLLERSFHRKPKQLKDRWLWWPRKSPPDPFTSSLYASHLAQTPRAIYYSTTGQTLRPSEATFFEDDHEAHPEVKLLKLIDTPNLVETPTLIHAALKTQIKVLDPAFVKRSILSNVERIKSSFMDKSKRHMTVKEILDIVRFLRTEQETSVGLQGLPLLPLADGTLATFQDATGSAPYFAWDSFSQARSLFPSHRMIDPEFSIFGLEKEYNVSKLDGAAVKDLISSQVQQGERLENSDKDYANWATSFWQGYHWIGVQEDDVASFPLVLTTRAGVYVSLRHCRSHKVLVILNSTELAEDLRVAMEQLGIITVLAESCPQALNNILKSDIYNHVNVWNVVRFFQSMDFSTISSCFNNKLSATARACFARWCSPRMTQSLPDDLKRAASYLPIWALLDGSDYVSAVRAMMLPYDLTNRSVEILHFATPQLKEKLVAHSAPLFYRFEVRPLTTGRVWAELGLRADRVLQPQDVTPYRPLLDAAIASSALESSEMLVIPNSHNILISARSLYGRSHPLFLSTFEPFPDKLAHQDIQDLEPALRPYGLRTQMDFVSFEVCVSTIHNEASDTARRTERAAGLYNWYSETFPVLAQGDQWSQLDGFRFIPRTASHRVAHYPSEYLNAAIRDQDLASPQEVVLPAHESIAWTQRILFNPSNRLTIANQAIGVPTPIEVYMHLRVLVLQIAPNHPPTLELLSDIQRTYRYLEDHTGDEEFRGSLVNHRRDPLFLNVDNPEVLANWTWRSAEQLYICTGTIKDIPNNNYWGVRKSLSSYTNLLRLAKVGEIKAAKAQTIPTSASEDELASMRSMFNAMRMQAELTDVTFVAEMDDSEDSQQFHAHRAFLVSRSAYFHGLFCNSFHEAQASSAIIKVQDSGVDCVRQTLDYLYTWKIPDEQDQDILLEIMKLADYWSIPGLFEAIQIRIINLGLISVDSYRTLRGIADTYRAVILQEACNVFETENQHEIEMFDDRPTS